MGAYDPELLKANKRFGVQIKQAADRYLAAQDARWMFARAHQLITEQIDDAIEKDQSAAGVFRNANELLRFNMSFASAFLAAVAGKPSAPWVEAFIECQIGQASYTIMFPTDYFQSFKDHPAQVMLTAPTNTAVLMCSMSMADAHINTDIVNSLKTVGCIDPHDYGNILLFVERGSRKAIIELIGKSFGPTFDYLKEHLMPLDKIWRNAVYQSTCHVPVPDIETSFVDTVDKNSRAMMQISPSAH
jgi:hypothetical protein